MRASAIRAGAVGVAAGITLWVAWLASLAGARAEGDGGFWPALRTVLDTPHWWPAAVAAIALAAWVTHLRLEVLVRERLAPDFATLVDKLTRDLPGMVYQFRFSPLGHGSVTFSSAGIRTIYEIDPEEARRDGNQILNLVHPEDRERILGSLWQSHVHLTPWNEEFRVILPTAGERWRLGHARVERLPDGGTLWHGVVVDTTASKRAALSLETAQREVMASNRARSRLLAILGHDIRTPIHGMLGFAHLLKEGTEAERAENLAALSRSGESLLELVDDILELARAEAGELSVRRRPVDLRACVAEAVALARTRATARGLRVEAELDADVPAGIETDRVRLLQVLNNLLTNAVKFTLQGEVVLRVGHVPAEDGVGRWSFAVRDTGPGVAERDRERIFREFQQAGDASTGEGSGLGLAIAREICRRLGGEITLESRPGQGATFTATIQGRAVAPPARAAEAGPIVPRLRRVLVVDDHALNGQLARRLLGRLGCEARSVTTGAEAIEACREEPFDLVLMDVELHGRNGLEITGELRALERRGELATAVLRIVALTARSDERDRAACLAAGMDDFLRKPLRDVELQRVLDGTGASAVC